jgi:hypothetical protein
MAVGTCVKNRLQLEQHQVANFKRGQRALESVQPVELRGWIILLVAMGCSCFPWQ